MLYWTCYNSMVDGVSTDFEQVVMEPAPESRLYPFTWKCWISNDLLFEVLLLIFMNSYTRYFDISSFIQWSILGFA